MAHQQWNRVRQRVAASGTRRWEGDGAEFADLTMLARPFPAHGPLLDRAGKPVTFACWYIDWLQKAELTAQVDAPPNELTDAGPTTADPRPSHPGRSGDDDARPAYADSTVLMK